MNSSNKNARTIKEYTTTAYGYTITVPSGSLVSNKTACGPDDNYRFWVSYGPEVIRQCGTKMPNGKLVAPMMLLHDLEYRGLNIPAEYCEPYAA